MDIRWEELGDPGAPAIVLVHGLGGSMRGWDRVAPLLAARFRVLRLDLPGFGGSPGRSDGVPGMARALIAVLDEAGVDEVVAAGHSMGGLVATAVAEAEPDRVGRLVLVNSPPSYESRTASRGGAERLLRAPVFGGLAWRAGARDGFRRGLRSAFAPGFPVPDAFAEDMCRTSHEVFVRASAAVDAYLQRRPLFERLGALTQQVLVVFGERDGRVDPRTLDGYGPLSNVTVTTIPEAGHTPIWEAPERAAELIGVGAGVVA